MTQTTNSANPTGTQAVDRAARLLTEIVDASAPLSFSELAAASGLAKSTTSRLLFALERHGLVRREDGVYRPGSLFIRYSWRAGREADLVEVSKPFLERLGARTGETVNLGVPNRALVEEIAQVDSRYVLGGSNWVGRVVPLHCSAQGKVLLAFGAADLPGGRLERLTEHTITSRAVLATQLEEVRRRGYAITAEELEPGLVAISAPVFRETGAAVAALSISAPTTRIGPSRVRELAAACVTEASALSGLLGYRPRSDRPRRKGAA